MQQTLRTFTMSARPLSHCLRARCVPRRAQNIQGFSTRSNLRGDHYDPPTGYLFGLKPGQKYVKEGWEKLYRKFIGILPGEENQQGYGCINGINIFNYFKPWQVFDLDPQNATNKDIKNAYHRLSKIYHPDVPETGDAAIFDCLTIMYKSISAEA